MPRRYRQGISGEWIAPRRHGYRIACCDCGLVHVINFRLHKEGKCRQIQMQVTRNNRATAAVRRYLSLSDFGAVLLAIKGKLGTGKSLMIRIIINDRKKPRSRSTGRPRRRAQRKTAKT